MIGGAAAATILAALMSTTMASASESHPSPSGDHGSSSRSNPTSSQQEAGSEDHQASSAHHSAGQHSAPATKPSTPKTSPTSTHVASAPRRTTAKAPQITASAAGRHAPAGPRRGTAAAAEHARPVLPVRVWGANPPSWPPRTGHPPIGHTPVGHLPIRWSPPRPVNPGPWGPGRLDHGPVIRDHHNHTSSPTNRAAASAAARPSGPQSPRTITPRLAARVAAGAVRPASFPPPDPGAAPRRVPPKPVYKQMVPRNAILAAARRIETGHGPGWHRGRRVPYAWDAGHGRRPGPTWGSAGGEGSSVDAHTYGVDCSGFARWVYALAYHHDVLHAGNTNNQIAGLHRDPHRHPGDLVFFGDSRTNTVHVGVYIGHGMMIDAPETGQNVKTQPVSDGGHIVGFYHGPTVRVRVRSASTSTNTRRLIDHNPIAARHA